MITFIANNEVVENDKNKVCSLLFSSFGIQEPPLAKYNYLLKDNSRLVGYAAITDREIIINDNKYRMAFLGSVCVDKEHQRKGYGKQLVALIIEELKCTNYDGIILNCGMSIVEFYTQNGFSVISNTASYDRDGYIEIDDDPVMYYGLKVKDIADSDVIHLGNDF